MPDLKHKKSGETVFVPDDALADMLSTGLYEVPAGTRVNVELQPGLVGQADAASLPSVETTGAAVESEDSFRARERSARIDREHGGIVDKGIAIGETALDELTFGASGAIADAALGEQYRENRLGRQEANPLTVGATRVGTALGTALASGGSSLGAKALGATPLGRVTKLGAKVAKAGEGASLAAKAGRLAAGGVIEGGAQGFGQGVQELRDSDKPVTWERAGSVLSSRTLFGAGVGAGANFAAKGLEKTLSKAKTALDDIATRSRANAEIAEDLVGLDAKQLKAMRATETEALEAARVPQRAQVADEIKAFRAELKQDKVWLAGKDSGVDGLQTVGKRTFKADKALDNLLDDPKALAENPKAALRHLRVQEAALDDLAAKTDELRAAFAGDTSGTRAAALDKLPAAIERNRALQQKIAALADPSPRMVQIDDAIEAAKTGGKRDRGMVDQLAGGTAFGAVASMVGSIPVIGQIPGLAQMAGAKAAQMVTEGLGKSIGEQAARASKALDMFLDVGRKVAPAAPVLATKTLSEVAYSPDPKPAKGLAKLYKTRADEIRSQVTTGPDGRAVMRPDARARMAANLAPIRAADPILGDRIETQSVRKFEFLANALPKRPDLGGLPTGPDLWQPSEFQMRAWARMAAAAEDPHGVFERLVDGTVTPEDAKVMREVYPEMLAELTQNLLERLPELRASLPYHRRLALSMLTGVPVDSAMSPRILRVLQASFQSEPGTQGGTQAPRPQPQFGSVKAAPGTQSQQREQNA